MVGIPVRCRWRPRARSATRHQQCSRGRRKSCCPVGPSPDGVLLVMSASGFSKFAFDAAAQMPRKLFGYDVVDFLGEGAGSRIYVVNDPLTHQLYALKHVVR